MKYAGHILFCLLLAALACTDEYYIDVKDMAGKTPEEVAEVMGEPDTTYIEKMMLKRIVHQVYEGKKAEFLYPKGGVLSTIRIKNTYLPFAAETIQQFGLEPKKPSRVIDNTLISWRDYEGFDMVSIYADRLDSCGYPVEYTVQFTYKK